MSFEISGNPRHNELWSAINGVVDQLVIQYQLSSFEALYDDPPEQQSDG